MIIHTGPSIGKPAQITDKSVAKFANTKWVPIPKTNHVARNVLHAAMWQCIGKKQWAHDYTVKDEIM